MCSDEAKLQTGTAEEMPSLSQEGVKNPTTNENTKSTINVVYFTMMMTTTGYSLSITSTWPYLQKIDQSVSPTFYGWTFFAFCLSSIIADLIYGKWMNSRPSREPLLFSMIAMMLSGLVYALAQGIGGSNGLWTVLISRILLGFVRGNMTITRTVVAQSTTVKTRSNTLTNLGILMTLGFVLGPGIQALVAFIGEKGLYVSNLMSLNLYTVPALTLIIFAIINGALVIKYFKEVKMKQSDADNSHKDDEPVAKKLLPCICLIGVWTIVSFSVSSMDTIMVPFIQHQFAFTREDAVKYAGFVFSGQGIVALFHQLLLKQLLKSFSDRVLLLFGCSIFSMSFIFFTPLGNKQIKIAGNLFVNGTLKVPKHGEEIVGCPMKYDWCKTTPQIWLPSLILAIVCFAVGFSTCFNILISLYTKLLPNQKQGTVVSILSAVGNTGRLVAPIAASASYVDIGPRYTVICIGVLMLTSLLSYLSLFKRMVPAAVSTDLGTADELILKQRIEGDSQTDQVLYASSV